MGKDWNDILRQKMEGHRQSPPDGLWEDIREQMDVTPMVKPRPSIKRRWYYGVAAAVVALVGFFAVYHPHQEEKSSLAEAAPQENNRELLRADESSVPVQDKDVKVSGVTALPLLAKSDAIPVEKKEAVEEVTSEDIPSEEMISEETAVVDNNDSAVIDNVKMDELPTTAVASREQDRSMPKYDAMAYANDEHQSRSTSSSDRWSVALKASGGLLASNTTEQTLPVYYDNSMPSSAYSDYNPINPSSVRPNRMRPYRMTEYVADHHLPIRMGVSVQYRLDDHTALQSGINYTYLYSKFSVPLYENSDYEQKLRYIGIPFGVARQLWSKNRFYLYAAAGVMLEKCINDKPWQWSVNGALGAEYRFTRQAGFYLEPSLGYYFDDGTSLEHYYSEHPWAPAIEFGLRLHLKK